MLTQILKNNKIKFSNRIMKTSPYRGCLLKNNSKGMAVVETIPIIIIMMLLVNFSLGFFGVIHTGILNSISARNYSFDTLRHRFDNKYFRKNNTKPYDKVGYRYHGTVSENLPKDSTEWMATARFIDFLSLKGTSKVEEEGGPNTHNSETFMIADGSRNDGISVNPVWIKTIYGICLDLSCGDKR